MTGRVPSTSGVNRVPSEAKFSGKATMPPDQTHFPGHYRSRFSYLCYNLYRMTWL